MIRGSSYAPYAQGKFLVVCSCRTYGKSSLLSTSDFLPTFHFAVSRQRFRELRHARQSAMGERHPGTRLAESCPVSSLDRLDASLCAVSTVGRMVGQRANLSAVTSLRVLSIFVKKLALMRALQALMSIGTCVFLGLFTARICGRLAGWIAFWLAALYALFYAYSWPFLRDGLAWFITAALL